MKVLSVTHSYLPKKHSAKDIVLEPFSVVGRHVVSSSRPTNFNAHAHN